MAPEEGSNFSIESHCNKANARTKNIDDASLLVGNG